MAWSKNTDGCFTPVMARVHLHLPINDHMEEVGRLALTHQFDMGRKALKERYPQHAFDVTFGHPIEQT